MAETVLAWHWVGDKLRGGQPVPKTGRWLRYQGALEMCRRGLHASIDPWDALRYAPGDVLCRVECAGEIIYGDDKLVCTRRKIIKRKNMERHLRAFARGEALRVIHLWDAPEVVREYLETGREDIRIAAWEAARDAARDVAWDAARNVAWEAARDVAREAAWAAAWDVEEAASADRLRAIVHDAFGEEE